jgi:ATP-binding cassette subfamily F protein uup
VTTQGAGEKLSGPKHAAGEPLSIHSPARAPAAARKLSYNEQRELERLPALIDALEEEQRSLAARIAAPEFYREPGPEIAAALARLEALQQELTDAYARWDELDSRA